MEFLGFRKEPTSTIKQLLTEYDSYIVEKNLLKLQQSPKKVLKKNIDDYYRGRGRTRGLLKQLNVAVWRFTSDQHRILDVPQLYMHLESSREL